MSILTTRRKLLVSSSMGGATLLLACQNRGSKTGPARGAAATPVSAMQARPGAGAGEEIEVTAVEDLMREHGVIRRALIVYREASVRLRVDAAEVPADALHKTATLFRTFAEDYHEKQLEEAYIFPRLKADGGALANEIDVLFAQHQRGREITDYLLASTAPRIAPAEVQTLARLLELFARMYEEHAAIEDTVTFPAWKKTMTAKELDETGDKFEEIEHKTFGKDGFEDALGQIAAIEHAFGLELAMFTPPPPPPRKP
jgi:hemerythrin-like domain-containing protein